jgi:hypothetical protein
MPPRKRSRNDAAQNLRNTRQAQVAKVNSPTPNSVVTSNSNSNIPEPQINLTKVQTSTNTLSVNTMVKHNTLMQHQIQALQYSSKVVAEKPFVVQEPKTYATSSNNTTHNVTYIPRGCLIWASTGAGKTTIAAGLCLQYLADNRRIMIISTVQNTRSNNISKYVSEMYTRYRPWVRALFGNITQTTLLDLVRKRVTFFSYTRFHNCFKELGTGACQTLRDRWAQGREKMALIIDESHDLVSTPSGWTRPQKEAAIFLRDWLMNDANRTKMYRKPTKNKKVKSKPQLALHVYCMTATPGDSFKEWMQTLKFVQPLNANGRDGFQHWPFSTNYATYSAQVHKFFQVYGLAIKAKILVGVDLTNQTFKNQRILAKQHHRHNPMIMGPLHFLICMAVLGSIRDQPKTKGGYKVFHAQLDPTNDQFLMKLRIMQNYLTKTDLGRAFKNTMSNIADTVAPLLDGFEDVPVRNDGYSVFASPKLKAIADYIGNTQMTNGTPGLKGRQLVYTVDTQFTARILGHFLRTLPRQACYRDVSDIVFSAGDAQRRTPLTMLYNNMKARTSTKCRYNFVIAKKTKDVKIAAETMNADKEQTMVRLHNLNMQIIEANQHLNQYHTNNRYGMLNNNESRRLLQEKRRLERHLEAVKKVGNNLHGELLKMVILSGGDAFQGLDIHALRRVHMLDHMTTWKRQKQLMGRGARGFGHAKLNTKDQTVHLHQYHMQVPKEFDTVESMEKWVHETLGPRFKGKSPEEQLVNQKMFMRRVKTGLKELHKYKFELMGRNNHESMPISIMSLNDIMPDHRNKKQSVKNIRTLETYLRK